MCFDEEDTAENPMITPCKCLGDTRYVHVDCLRKWHTAEADNQVCFLSSVDATCSVCKSTFRSDFKLKDGRLVKLFKSSLEPPYVSLLVATKHEMAQRLFNTRFQLSFSTLLKPDGRNGTRPLLLGRSSGSDMVLDYRTVSARHATIRLKNGEFIFTDAGSSNGSYLYLRRPVELTPSQSVQFRLGRSMISMKVVNKWNKRLLRAVSRRAGLTGSNNNGGSGDGDDHSVGSNDDDVRITDNNGEVSRTVHRRTRDNIMEAMPPMGTLSQNSPQHMDLLYALAYPKRTFAEKEVPKRSGKSSPSATLAPPMEHVSEGEDDESKAEEEEEEIVDEFGAQPSSPLEEVSNDFNEMNIEEKEDTTSKVVGGDAATDDVRQEGGAVDDNDEEEEVHEETAIEEIASELEATRGN
jgi:predicted component of type VI protein secretion system